MFVLTVSNCLYVEKLDLEFIILWAQAHLLWAFKGIQASAGTKQAPQE